MKNYIKLQSIIVKILITLGSTLPFLQSALAQDPAQCFDLKVGNPVIVARDGEVVARFIEKGEASYSDLYLDYPTGAFEGVIFNNQTTLPGSTVSLGTFKAGTELIFRIHVNDTGEDLVSGLASRNRDNMPHARVNDLENETYVGFEDLIGIPDSACPNGGYNYVDLVFAFTNVQAAAALGGSATSVNLQQVVCRNLTTRKRVIIKIPDERTTSWDCASSGLGIKEGDVIQQTIRGFVPIYEINQPSN